MTYYKLTNISGGLLVCDLNTLGKTLRLQHKQSIIIPESEITPHMWNLIVNYIILCTEAFTSDEEYIPPSSGGNNNDNEDDHYGDNTTTTPSNVGAVRYDIDQSLLSDEKVRARKNINAQKTLIEHTPKLVLSTKAGLSGNYVLIKVFDTYSVYLVRVSDKVFTYDNFIGLTLEKYDSTSGLIDNFLIADEDIEILTDNGSFCYKDYLYFISKQDVGISIKGNTLNVSGVYLIYEVHSSNNFYYEVTIPEKVEHFEGVSKTVDENSDDKTLPTAKAVYDFVSNLNLDSEELKRQLDEHNNDEKAHTDIRELIEDLSQKIDDFGESQPEGGEIKPVVGVSVQSDHNQNDPTQPDYIKNRLAWSEPPAFEPMEFTLPTSYEGFVWEGDTEGRANFYVEAIGASFYKISDLFLPYEKLLNSFVTVVEEGYESEIILNEWVISSILLTYDDDKLVTQYVVSVKTAGRIDLGGGIVLDIPEEGTYSIKIDNTYVKSLQGGFALIDADVN